MADVRRRRPRKPRRGMLPAQPAARAEAAGTVYPQPFEYRARAGQAELHADPARFKVVVAHRRFGKTVFAVNQLVRAAVEARLTAPRFAYVAPLYRQAKAIVWDYLKQYGRRIEGARFHETELRCDLPNGARISLYGADDPDSLRGLYFDGVVLDEYAQMDPKAWSEVIRPALADRGGWAIFIGTPMGRNSFWRLYEQAKTAPDWRAALFRASATGVLPSAELAAAKRAMSASEYAQEFECSFDAAIRGAYYGTEIAAAEAAGRIARVAAEPRLPVHTAWDLGIGDATAIWFYQLAGREIRLIDYYENSGVGLDHYARELQRRGYVYGEHKLDAILLDAEFLAYASK
jgi:phage terminase large subunit